jgi:hypothetical protein
MMTPTTRRVSWLLQGVVAVILLQTLFFKFTAAEESVYIFRTLGAEPWGRVGSGIAELVVAGLLLTSRFAVIGALGALAVIAGAIMSHLLFLGLEVQGDGGLLFGLALTVFAASAAIVFLRRAELTFAKAMVRKLPAVGDMRSPEEARR